VQRRSKDKSENAALMRQLLQHIQQHNKTAKSPTYTPLVVLIEMMRHKTKDYATQRFGVSILREAVELEGLKPALVRLGAVEQILVTLRFFLTKSDVVEHCTAILYFLAFEIEGELRKNPTSELLPHLVNFSCKAIAKHKTLPSVTTPCCNLLFALSMEDDYLQIIAEHARAEVFSACFGNLDPALPKVQP
jgi:hypothetical protein